MTVQDFYEKFKELMECGKGSYKVSTDCGLAPLDSRLAEVYDDTKEVIL